MAALPHLCVFALVVAAAAAQTFCPTAPTTPIDRRPNKTRLTYATFNAEFLFLVGYGALRCPGADCKWATASMARAHLQQIATIIRKLDADILQLDEVEDCAVLHEVVAELARLGDHSYASYVVQGADAATGQNVALLTRVDPSVDLARVTTAVRLPVANSTCPRATGYAAAKSVAKNLWTTFKVEGFLRPITVVGAHFLANPMDKVRCYEREGQATVISGVAWSKVHAGHHVIISGDFNDWPRTVPDCNGDRPISNALGILERPGFLNAGARVPQADRYTQWFDRNHDCQWSRSEVSGLDHLVVSTSLASLISDVAFRNDLYQASCDGVNSDHIPLVIKLAAEVATVHPLDSRTAFNNILK